VVQYSFRLLIRHEVDMIEVRAPNPLEGPRPWIFLAGSIKTGINLDWQGSIANAVWQVKGTIFNPKRDDWDPTWLTANETEFVEQVEWELDALEKADLIFLYFVPGTKGPISFLNLGLFSRHPGLYVCCPLGFWRKGSVDVTCAKYNINRVERLNDFIAILG